MEKGRKKRVALFVGVDEYPKDPGIPPLNCAVSDAKALEKFFAEREGQFDRVEGLANPTEEEVTDRIDELTENLGAGDLFLFYFAGHGTDDNGKQKLLCRNSKVRYGVSSGALELDYVARGAKYHTAVVLDACRTPLEASRSGNGKRTMDRRDLAFVENLVEGRTGESGSLTVLCSCDEKMSAGEIPQKRHGLFTLALLEVLAAADRGHRRLDFNQELSDAVGTVMRRIAQEERQGENQRPWIRASGGAPIFLRPTLDTGPLFKWVDSLADAGVISRTQAADCYRAIDGNTEEPGGRCLFDLARFFSNWDEESRNPDGGVAFAAGMIRALCEIGELARKLPQAVPAEPAKPQPAAEKGGDAEQEKRTRPLVREERESLRRFCASVSGAKREDLEGVRTARTEEEAVNSLERVTLGWVETYGRGNALGRGVNRPLGVRVAPDGQALATDIRHVLDHLRTPMQVALLRALNAALSMGGRV